MTDAIVTYHSNAAPLPATIQPSTKQQQQVPSAKMLDDQASQNEFNSQWQQHMHAETLNAHAPKPKMPNNTGLNRK